MRSFDTYRGARRCGRFIPVGPGKWGINKRKAVADPKPKEPTTLDLVNEH
jgi:hypothetical protein